MADAVIGVEQIVLYHLPRQHLGDRIKRWIAVIHRQKNCMAARLDNAQLIGILNKGIDAAARAGCHRQNRQKVVGTLYGARETFFGRYGLPIASLAGGCCSRWLWRPGCGILQLHIKIRAATGLISRGSSPYGRAIRISAPFLTAWRLVFVGDCQSVILHCNSAAAAITGFSVGPSCWARTSSICIRRIARGSGRQSSRPRPRERRYLALCRWQPGMAPCCLWKPGSGMANGTRNPAFLDCARISVRNRKLCSASTGCSMPTQRPSP